MATIPEMRPRLLYIADRLPYASLAERMKLAAELRWIESELYRRSPIRKAAPRARSVTPIVKNRIRVYAAQHPDLPIRDIGRACGVDGGRVSEALAGKRR